MLKKSSVRKSVAGSGRMIAVVEEDVPCENATAELTDFNSDTSNRSSSNLNDSLLSSDADKSGSFSTRSRASIMSSGPRRGSSMRSYSSGSTDRIKLTHAESVRHVNVENLTMNKLRFASLKLHGRKKEIELLRTSFDRFVNNLANADEGDNTLNTSRRQSLARRGSHMTRRRGSKKIADLFPDFSNTNSSEVVFISGESGTGKVS